MRSEPVIDRSFVEHPLTFGCEGATLVGVVTKPRTPSALGVVIVPGGPNYRASAHRQFTLLARALACAGVPSLRFDFRGMGDAEGDAREIGDVDADVGAAIDAFVAEHPGVRRIVLWGLCAGATNALTYLAATHDGRVAGLVLLNPWVRTEHTIARTYVKHYYTQRLASRAFWSKLARGDVEVGQAIAGLLGHVRTALRPARTPAAPDRFQDRMARGLAWFAGPVLLVLCRDDLTAREFDDYAARDPKWEGILARDTIRRVDVPLADHTFSSARWRAEAEALTLGWLHEHVAGAQALHDAPHASREVAASDHSSR